MAQVGSLATPRVEDGIADAERRGVSRNAFLPVAVALIALWGAGTAAAQSQPPAPTATVPAPGGGASQAQAPTPPPPPDPTPVTPAPVNPVPAAPTTPVAPTARGINLDSWAGSAAARVAPSWPGLAGANLSRDATRGDLDTALGILTGAPHTSANPSAPLSVWAAHAAFISALGLGPERLGIQKLSVDGGPALHMPANAGSEVLVRELGFVYNQPSSRDGRERARRETIRLADLVYMLDRARGVGSWQRARLARYRTIHLPAMDAQRFAVVQAAVWQIGQPYVWAGDWPKATTGVPWGAQAHGGFDCSGLVWWAFKGSAKPSEMSLGTGLRGRTADDMAWEDPAEKVPATNLEAGDLVFFGPSGPTSKKGTISHTGISLGAGWVIHSSGSRGGPSISFLSEYWPSATAWGRHVAQLGA